MRVSSLQSVNFLSTAMEIPHYNFVTQMMNSFSTLCEHLIEKSEEQQKQISDLSYFKTDFEEKLLNANSLIQSLEVELKTHELKISHVSADSAQFEQQANERAQELKEANEAIQNYKELNDDLCIKIEKLEMQEKVKTAVDKQQAGQKLAESLEKIRILEQKVFEAEQREKQFKQEVLSLRNSNYEWETKTKQLFTEIQQNEIIGEKKEYEKNLRMSEMVTIMKDQKKQIRELEDQIILMKHKE